MTESIWVVPCFNEEKRLLVKSFFHHVENNSCHFLFVNDGSTDNTSEVLVSLCAQNPQQLHYLDLPSNQGKANAVRLGILQAMKDFPQIPFIGFLDADLATPLTQLSYFLETIQESPASYNIVIGSRVKLLGRKIIRKAYRHYLGRVFSTVVGLLFPLAIYDTQCGAKLFRRGEYLEKIFIRPFISKWIFDVEIFLRYQRADQRLDKVYELPLKEWEDVGGSKLKGIDFLKAFWDLLRLKFSY